MPQNPEQGSKEGWMRGACFCLALLERCMPARPPWLWLGCKHTWRCVCVEQGKPCPPNMHDACFYMCQGFAEHAGLFHICMVVISVNY